MNQEFTEIIPAVIGSVVGGKIFLGRRYPTPEGEIKVRLWVSAELLHNPNGQSIIDQKFSEAVKNMYKKL